jgi:hypothetical protein
MVRSPLCLLVVAALAALAPQRASAQNVTVATPFHGAGDSFYERFGTSWSMRGPNFFASFGGGNAAPPFGGYTPNAGLQGGFSFGGGPFSGGLNFSAAQGASRSITSTTPMLTTLNGYPGFFTDSVQRPFVTGFVPIVGPGAVGYAPLVSGVPVQPQLSPLASTLPWQEKLAGQALQLPSRAKAVDEEEPLPVSPAGSGANSDRNGRIDPLPPTRAERERQKATEDAARNNAARTYYEKGLAASENGKPGVAKIYFEMAAKRATGPLKETIEERMSQR